MSRHNGGTMGCGETCGKISALAWKFWKLRVRSPCTIINDIIFIVLSVVVLLIVSESSKHGTTYYEPFCTDPAKSTGSMPFLCHIKDIPNNQSTPGDNDSSPMRGLVLYYSPENAEIAKVMSLFKVIFSSVEAKRDSKHMESAFSLNSSTVFAGIQFDDSYRSISNLKDIKKLRVSIRFPAELRYQGDSIRDWQTQKLYEDKKTGNRESNVQTGPFPSYYKEGFLLLQHILAVSFMLARDGLVGRVDKPDDLKAVTTWTQQNDFPSLYMQRFPHSEWRDKSYLNMLPLYTVLFILLATSNMVGDFTKLMVLEKELQLKEAILTMGVSNSIYWASWYLQFFTYLLVGCLIFLIPLKMALPATNILVLLLLIVFFAISAVSLILLFCSIFTTAMQASLISQTLWMFSAALILIKGGPVVDLALSLICNCAFHLGLKIICAYEITGEGSQWNNFSQKASSSDVMSLAGVILILIFDTILYLLIALYIDAVFPGENGVPMPWNFPCRPSLWRAQKISETDNRAIRRTRSEFFEAEPKDLKVGVQIKNLKKVFGQKTAVQGLNMNLYEGEITVLLGHNGAGKTTVVSMITGMLRPTSGTAIVNGYDIQRDMKTVRKWLGICPQQNVIYNELTVREHLYFYCRLRGLSKSESEAESKKYILALDLKDKRDVRGKKLSGGMKRKLSVCIAFCGDSKIVLLDEPTSGMDPTARRSLWNLLANQKKGRTILLTTHYMDEADVLGDRIAIMSQGELKCYGSSFFLKKKYGAGYKLIIAKGPRCDVSKITAFLKSSIPEAQMISNTELEVTYALPENRVSSFEAMLKQLEAQSNSLAVQSYGVALSTLEEVFMKVGADPGHEEHKSQNVGTVTDTVKPSKKGILLIPSQCAAMLYKRWKVMRHSWMIWLILILLPPLMIMMVLLLGRNPVTTQLPALPLTLSEYGEPIVMLENKQSRFYDSYRDLVEKESQIVEDVNISVEAFRLTEVAASSFQNRYIMAATFGPKSPATKDSKTSSSTNSNSSTIGVWFNSNPLHSPGIALSYALNAVFRKISGCSDCEIQFINAPFPFSRRSQMEKLGNTIPTLGIFLGFTLSMTSTIYIIFIIKERKCKSRHQQYVAGVKVPIFWLITFLFDFATYFLICLLIVIVVGCFQEDGYRTVEDLCRLLVILLYIAVAFLPVVYVFAYIFDIPATGFNIMLSLFIIGLLEFSAEVSGWDRNSSSRVTLQAICIILFPHYSLVWAITEAHITYNHRKMCSVHFEMCAEMGIDREHCLRGEAKDFCRKAEESYYKWESHGIGSYIASTCIEGAVFVLILFLIEYGVFTIIINCLIRAINPRKPKIDTNEDEDVAEERRRIKSMSVEELTTTYDVAVRDLTKYYGNFTAVNSLCVGVKRYECFGLLGLNGAGKTTTFRMITGDVRMSRGDGWVKGYRLQNQIRKIQTIIGYCPQFDALLNDLTARETIIMFGLIKGYRYSDTKSLADGLSESLDFREHLDKHVKKMSGGNKRKLSAAISLLGDPEVLYFDEPTAGMDPATKVYFREEIRKIRDKGKCVIMTSHSLEECEALCTRLAIMVNGNFKCLGSVQHLKSKFAKGCTFTIKIKNGANPASSNTIQKYVRDNIPAAQLIDTHEDFLTYSVTGSSLPWSKIFGILEGGKRSISDLEDYSIGQGTLEQVFLSFIKQQKEV